jgi:glycosyltransferase involved in cell wall biosynthesis
MTATNRPVRNSSNGDTQPKVAIVVGGRFFAFDVARALERRGALAGVVTAYPKAWREGIPFGRLTWNPVMGLREGLTRRLLHDLSLDEELANAMAFGKWAARRLPECDVVQAWTGYALESIAAGRRSGAVTVALRASAHIRAQAALLREEFEQFGLQAPTVHAAMVERECEEYEQAHFINVISTFAYNSFVSQGVDPARLILTPLAGDIAEVSGVPRVENTKGPLRVLFLGTVCLRKGVHYLLRAARTLGRDVVEVSLVGGMTADGRMILERLGQGGEWKGHVARDQLKRVFAEHDVLVLPSVEDGFGAVVTEAMAAGLPVIGTTNTGAPDVVEDGVSGLIIPPHSEDALVSAMSKLASDRELCMRMGRAALDSMRQQRSWDDFESDMMAKYVRALHQVRSG